MAIAVAGRAIDGEADRVELTTEWKLVHIEGVAASDHAAGTANVALSLGGAAHMIDLGPVFALKSR